MPSTYYCTKRHKAYLSAMTTLFAADAPVIRSTKAGASTPATPANLGHLLDLHFRSTKAGASTPATPRPPRSPLGAHAALNEGRGINPGDTPCHPSTARPRNPLNEGRGINPGDTQAASEPTGRSCNAQRRPGHQPRRHPNTRAWLVSACHRAQRRPGHQPRRHC